MSLVNETDYPEYHKHVNCYLVNKRIHLRIQAIQPLPPVCRHKGCTILNMYGSAKNLSILTVDNPAHEDVIMQKETATEDAVSFSNQLV